MSKLQQAQKQAQVQVISPQLQQSLKILQVPTLELKHLILEELQANPTLEELSNKETSLEETVSEAGIEGEEVGADRQKDELDFGNDFERLKTLSEDSDDYHVIEGSQSPYTADQAKSRQHFFDSIVNETSLQEHLMRQAKLSECSDEQYQAMEYIVGSLDDKGFLASSDEELVTLSKQPVSVIRSAIEQLKTFDPPGIGSRDLQECLLVQLHQRELQEGLAAKILKHHYDLLMRRKTPEIAKSMEVGLPEVETALEEIARLDPAPGRRYTEDLNRVVVADIIIEKIGEDWVAALNDEYLPSLGISTVYKQLIAQGKLSGTEKEYIMEKMRAGRFLIHAIEQRQSTIAHIVKAIIGHQKDFLEKGLEYLRPLTMSKVAQEIKVHETTVSRAVANKYVQTPQGVFELRAFFSGGLVSQEGKDISVTSIKQRIGKLLESEDPAKPLSDQHIAEHLAEEGISIARRTVAKYREELGYLATHLRRQHR